MTYDVIRFKSKLFDDDKIRRNLSEEDYCRYRDAFEHRKALDCDTAQKIAQAMKQWALDNGCTHYSHWFHPLNGSTAEKHNAFARPKDDATIFSFSYRSLIRDESDASSFPSGGLRETFEARGYTYWDIHSPVFIRDEVLYIPTIFVSYTGESLDTKGPLLKSMDALNFSAVRLINLLSEHSVTSVVPCAGFEQEFFLIDKESCLKRRDLFLSGKTLFGALPPKAQQLERHYCGSIPKRVSEFMKDVDEQLWDLGIYVANEHNEVAPGQFEMSPLYSRLNEAIDQNMIMMDVLSKTALQHDLVCLLNESPFKGVNGSGKHSNYSLVSSDGQNLFEPGSNPKENVRFLLLCAALLKAVDSHADMIRLSCGESGNDDRLGGNEAPPAIVSVYLGETIEEAFESLSSDLPKRKKTAKENEYISRIIQNLPKDNSDRNRTSPIAFTGNKFEFRMLGSSVNPSFLNTVINTAMAQSLDEFYEQLKRTKTVEQAQKKALTLIDETYRQHKRILYSGNGYSTQWVLTAKERGLENIPTFFEAIATYKRKKNVELFEKYGIYSLREIEARSEIMTESYVNVRSIELKTLISCCNRDFVAALTKELQNISVLKAEYTPSSLKEKAALLVQSIDACSAVVRQIEDSLKKMEELSDNRVKGEMILKDIIPLREKLRSMMDECEGLVSTKNRPFPDYEELFFKLDS